MRVSVFLATLAMMMVGIIIQMTTVTSAAAVMTSSNNSINPTIAGTSPVVSSSEIAATKQSSTAPPTPPCRPPYGPFNETLEGPCYTVLDTSKEGVQVREYNTTYGDITASACVVNFNPDPTIKYTTFLRAAVNYYFFYITPGGNNARTNITRTAPFIVRPYNVTNNLNFTLTWMLSTTQFPNGKAPHPDITIDEFVRVERFPTRTVATYHFQLTGMNYNLTALEAECAKVEAMIPNGWKPVGINGAEIVYYSGERNEPADYECWFDVKWV